MDLFTIMGSHFQRSIRTAVNMAVGVQMMFDSGESQYESSCAYYYSFLFSGWWSGGLHCTWVTLNGEYYNHFRWLNPVTGNYIYPNRSEMKIRRQ